MLYVKENDSEEKEHDTDSELPTSGWGKTITMEDVNIDWSAVEPR